MRKVLGKNKFSVGAMGAATLLLAACGGGDGGGGGNPPPPPPPPGNRPPVFTSQGTASVAEDTAGVFYTATATDADGNALTFSLAGGADQARFAITPQGGLSFVTPPDFEAPGDADANNSYLVTLQVSDGTTSATLNLTVTVTDVGSSSFRVRQVGTGFASPMATTPLADGRLLVVERAGRIRIFNPNTGAIAATPFLDIVGQTTTDGERGLANIALAPDFATTGTFYIFLTNTAGNIEIRRYRTLAGNRDQADTTTADLILTIPHANANNHNGGWLGFGPDGNLYITVGDATVRANAQDRNSLLGKILRINPVTDSFPGDANRDYAIPAGNPFAGGGGAPEVWAYGLRNPFRASFDSATGNFWIADVGEGSREEVDLMRPADGGANFGWAVVEGTLGTPQPGFTPPVIEYSHGTGPREGNSITGGVVYRGPVESLRGQYFFADFVRNNIWSVPVSAVAIGQTVPSSQFVLRNADFVPNTGTIRSISSFGTDAAGNLYITDLGGAIYRLEAN